jgi:hypothetical protein
MPSTLDFTHADSIIPHLSNLVSSGLDPLIAANYAGFVTVAAVCVYEMAVKDIFTNFATAKHPVLGSVIREKFDKISGRVKYKIIKDEYVPLFGPKYSAKFSKAIDSVSRTFLRENRRDIISSYNNIVIWRNDFVHAAHIPATATFAEVVRSYEDGKEVIRCLNSAMNR